MRRHVRWVGLCAVALVVGAPSVNGQATPEAAVRAFFAAGSGSAGSQRLDDLPDLFVPSGVLITVGVSDSAPAQAVLRSPREYVESAREWLATHTQFEVPTRFWVEEYGNVGHVFCAFEARRALDEEPFYRGVASFQLVWDGQRWRIITAYWQGERPGLPLPARYRGVGS